MPKFNPLVSFVAAVVVAVFVKGCIHPGWPAVLETLCALGFAGFIVWLNPSRKLEVNRTDFDKAVLDIEVLKKDLTNLAIKIGFQRR